MTNMNFIKFQSLGNDFILFDWRENSSYSDLHVKKLCDRHTGIGADGVLVLQRGFERFEPEAIIYNADGSCGGICLNGVRCVAHYLFIQHEFPNLFSIKMGGQSIEVRVDSLTGDIISFVSFGSCVDDVSVEIEGTSISGVFVDVGNPHFICKQEEQKDFFEKYAQRISNHSFFSQGTNVECVWQGKEPFEYNVLVYERGVGFTKACSSGAAAIMTWLKNNGEVKVDQKISLCMPGGIVTSWITSDNKIALRAEARVVFEGRFPGVSNF